MRPALALALVLVAPCARADYTYTRTIATPGGTAYAQEFTPGVGRGTLGIVDHATETFAAIDPAAGPGILITGTLANLRPLGSSTPYSAAGTGAVVALDLRIFSSASSDPATLFNLYTASPTAALFNVGNGLNTAPGPDFSVLLSAAATAQVRALQAAGQPVALGFGGFGGPVTLGVNFQGDLAYSVRAVPEPTSLALAGVGIVLVALRRRR